MKQYIADAPRYSDYLPTAQKMIDSMQITSQGNGPYGMTMGPNGTMTVTNGNISGTLTAPPGSKVNNFTIVPGIHYPHGSVETTKVEVVVKDEHVEELLSKLRERLRG
jgi:hypothetical protein